MSTQAAQRQPFENELYESAQRFAQSALKAYHDADWSTFFLHGGTAVEHLAKGYLASLHPSLIAKNDLNALLHASGHPELANALRSQFRSISVTEALERCKTILPGSKNSYDSLRLMIDVRNSVVHLAVLDVKTAEHVLVPFLKVAVELVREQKRDPDEFWGEFKDLASTALSDAATEAQRRVAGLLGAARITFSDRFARYEVAARSAVLASIAASYPRTTHGLERYQEQEVECPACATTVVVNGYYDVKWEAQDEYEIAAVVTFYPGYLWCKACDLELDGEDEMNAADLTPWQLEHVDEADFYDDLT